MAIYRLPTGMVTWKDMAAVVDAVTATRLMRQVVRALGRTMTLIRMMLQDEAVRALRIAIRPIQAAAAVAAAR